ncbi:MAG: isocitrate lyase/phosphoenolpyruvate mutase family protein [Nonomuraea sp.]|nr:isocitrate lyase/phosphoenolpyruvate mutase family protein [Nonomuraea sp.]NUP81063.1 isocitrate lyase/phosphoenolpyruvate mutase family protein [Nonomuraea sp.]NUT41578.1 isocitrate lyase/phosphoenolpyruvate mutase family protein [Thermoactinospora sp.]
MTSHEDKAVLFRSLHVPGRPLLLANAWDAASALVTEAAGAPAVATTSAGVAWSLGAPDGDLLDREAAVALAGRVAAAVRVPVTADIEGGYDDVALTVRGVLDAGVVGVNLEDADRGTPGALLTVEAQAARLSAARRAADEAGIPLFVNARIDTFLRGAGDLGETLERAAAYVEAGADGIFVPGVTDLATIGTLTAKLEAPLNILAGPGGPTVAELAGQGVARISLGSSVAQAAYAVARRATAELFASGTYTEVAGALDYSELNELLAPR